MSSPPRHDAWKPYRPDQQRVVLIRRDGALKPYIGFVVDFGIGRPGNEFLVTYVDDGITRTIRTEWVARGRLRPLPIDPNWLNRR